MFRCSIQFFSGLLLVGWMYPAPIEHLRLRVSQEELKTIFFEIQTKRSLLHLRKIKDVTFVL